MLVLLAPHVHKVNLLTLPLEKGLALSAIPVIFTSFGFHGSVPSIVSYMNGDIRKLLALNKKRLNRSTSEVPTQTTPPPMSVKKMAPVAGVMSAPNPSLTLEAINSPAPLIYAAVRAYIRNIMLKPVTHCP